MNALKPCPACGSDNHEQSMDVVRIGAGHMCGDVRCLSCGLYCARARWNAMLRPADIVAARIEGLREAVEIAGEYCSTFTDEETEEQGVAFDRGCFEGTVDLRIAELESTAPEVSETRAKAEAFDAAYRRFEDSNSDNAWWFLEQMENALAEATRKGAGT